jgi:hypothetical protein
MSPRVAYYLGRPASAWHAVLPQPRPRRGGTAAENRARARRQPRSEASS